MGRTLCRPGGRLAQLKNRTPASGISSITRYLPPNFNQADTDAIFAGFGFRSHAELAEDE